MAATKYIINNYTNLSKLKEVSYSCLSVIVLCGWMVFMNHTAKARSLEINDMIL